jgi:hypothetical protein
MHCSKYTNDYERTDPNKTSWTTIKLIIMNVAKYLDGEKFMWDGKTYSTEAEALKVKEVYEKDNFETSLIKEEDEYFLFTRRVVTEVVVEGQPPV